MNSRPSRGKTETDRFYLGLAFEEQRLSDDPKAAEAPQSAVGAVIAGPDGILSRSANVLPPEIKRAHLEIGRRITSDERYHFIEHAERAAIYRAFLDGKQLQGATLYCTRYPCSDCARAIAWSGIIRVVLASGYTGEERWIESQRAAARILRAAGITIRVLSRSSNLELSERRTASP